jgi:hypothetical protein
MREGQLFGYFGIFFGAFALIGLLLVIPTVVCVPLGIACGVRAIHRKQQVLGSIAIGLGIIGALALGVLLLMNAQSINLNY